MLKWDIESKPESKPYYIRNNTGGHNELDRQWMGCISEWGASVNGVRQWMGMFVFLIFIIMLLIGSMHVKYLHKNDSPWISFSLENAYYLECFHLIFVFVKTKTCMSPSAPLLLFSLVLVPLYLSFCYLKYLAIWLSTPLYIAKNVCFRDTLCSRIVQQIYI